jgi:hypothetical protein
MKTTTLLIISIILGITVNAYSQGWDNHWYFGNFAGLDFTSGIPVGVTGALETLEGVASISDEAGNLLFYTDGTTVWDRNHQEMPNGTNLGGGGSSSQSAVIVPLPGSSTLYYIFTVEDFEVEGGLTYSVVDMTLHGGVGDVISSSKNTQLLARTTEKLAAVAHANHRDVWIITHGLESADFYAFKLTPQGITGSPVISTLGTVYGSDPSFWYTGQLRISPSGRKIASSLTSQSINELFDFNTSNGQLSNHKNIPLDEQVYGMEFSPNDSILYLAMHDYDLSTIYMLQYHHLDPVPSFDTVDVMEIAPDGTQYGSIQLGPDNKIYVSLGQFSYMDVIHQPDNIGAACEYQEAAVNLATGTSNAYGLPQKIVVSACPLVLLGPDIVRCLGDSVILEPGIDSTELCPFTFTWFDGSSDASVTIDTSGSYWIEVATPDSTYRDSIAITFLQNVNTTLHETICDGESFEGYTSSGIYSDTLTAAFGCDSIRTLHLTVLPLAIYTLDTTVLAGGVFEGYTQSGIYRDTFLATTGCDSIRILYLTIIDHNTIIRYTLDACASVMANNTHMDYSEFTPIYPETIPCATVSAENLHRANIEKHSCTPGFDGNAGMCVDILESCNYDAGNSKSVIVEFTIDPPADSAVQITLLTFFEKSPNTYEWINGPTGPNEMARYYGLRVLKNGVEIFRDPARLTQLGWNLESFDFLDNAAFRCDSTAHFSIEWLPYCPFGGDEDVSVWDLDHISIFGGCVPVLEEQPFISGTVRHADGQGMPNVRVELSADPTFTTFRTTTTDALGQYAFNALDKHSSYYIRCYSNEDVLLGVSTADIIRIKKHLLGIDPYSSLQPLVASDINRNQAINVLDLIAIQKTLLGLHSVFPNNTSWRFGIVPQDFSLLNLSDFKESWHIESLQGPLEQMDFVAIKIGNP